MRLAFVSLLLLAGTAFPVEVPESKPRSLHLKRVRLKPGTFRPSALLDKELPTEAWAVSLPHRKYLLFDLDGDSRVTPGGGDGLAIEGAPFVVPLPETLLCEYGQCQLALNEDGTLLNLHPQDLSLPPALVAEASDLTEIRIRAGLAPVRIDPQASQALLKHFEYLKLNGRSDDRCGVSPHEESEGKPGWSAEGARAGMESNLFRNVPSFRDALRMWRATAWHGAPLFSPGLGSVGVGFQYNVAGLFFVDPEAPDTPLPQPPDHARGVPCRFCPQGENPSPTPGSSTPLAQRGYPVLVILPPGWQSLPMKAFTLVEASGRRPVEGLTSCPSAPANPGWPHNFGCAVFIPAKHLRPSTAYLARLEMEGRDPIEWGFTTADKGR